MGIDAGDTSRIQFGGMTEQLALTVAARGLATGHRSWPAAPLDTLEWSELLSAVQRNHTSGLLAQAIAEGALPVTPEQRESARRAHLEAMSTAIALELSLVNTIHQLDEAGIDYRVLNGLAHAHIDWPDASLRPFHDVAVLLPPKRYEEGISTLLAVGFARRVPEGKPGFDGRVSEGTTLVAPDGHELGVHRSLAAGAFGLTIDQRELFARATAFTVADCEVMALDAAERFLHACYHAALAHPVPSHIAQRDLVATAYSLEEADIALVLSLAGRWQSEVVVASAVQRAFADLAVEGSNPMRSWAERFSATPAQVRALRAHGGSRLSSAKEAIEGLRAAPQGEKVAYARSLLLRGPEHKEARNESAGQRVVRGLQHRVRQLRQH